MDTNSTIPTEDTEMTECDGEKVVTMMDVLQEQEDIEKDANAVLGASDEKNCTYSKGYIKRQAIYACLTCCGEAKDDPTKRAGICLACSLTCHENHDLIELYTKRNFRCDCGNPKFNSHPCQFTASKNDVNENNNYNQNFSGFYCICHRPYPDPEATSDDEMIQCIICEDWLHASHLEAKLPANDQYSEMICKSCMENNHFLHDYSNFAVNIDNDIIDVIATGSENTKSNGHSNNDTSTEIFKDESVSDDNSHVDTFTKTLKINDLTNTIETNKPLSVVEKPEQESDKSNDSQENQSSDNVSKANESIDTEKMEEDRLLADPEDENEKPLAQIESKSESSDLYKDNKVDENIHNQQCPNNGSKKLEEETSNNPNLNKDFEANLEEKSDTNSDKMEEEIVANPDIPKELDADMRKTTEVEDINKKTKEDIQENKDVFTKKDNNSEIGTNSLNLEGKDLKDGECFEENKKDITNMEIESNITSENSFSNTENNITNNIGDSSNILEQNQSNAEDIEIKNDCDSASSNREAAQEIENKNLSVSDDKTDNKRKFSIEENGDINENAEVRAKKVKLDSTCVRPKNIKKIFKGATFWPSDFRQKLCTCGECLTMYKDLSVFFLTEVDDTVSAYENLGEEKERIEGKPPSQYEKGLQALSSLDRIQQINALTEYNKMRDKLLEFLKSFKDRKEIVKEEDIKAFFAGMKPKREPDGVYFCR